MTHAREGGARRQLSLVQTVIEYSSVRLSLCVDEQSAPAVETAAEAVLSVDDERNTFEDGVGSLLFLRGMFMTSRTSAVRHHNRDSEAKAHRKKNLLEQVLRCMIDERSMCNMVYERL